MNKKLMLSLLAVLASGCARSDEKGQGYALLEGESFACSPPAQAEVHPWGKEGVSKVCNVRNGAFLAVENGYVQVRGQYDMGRKVGVWRWYDKNGNVSKEVDYTLVGK